MRTRDSHNSGASKYCREYWLFCGDSFIISLFVAFVPSLLLFCFSLPLSLVCESHNDCDGFVNYCGKTQDAITIFSIPITDAFCQKCWDCKPKYSVDGICPCENFPLGGKGYIFYTNVTFGRDYRQQIYIHTSPFILAAPRICGGLKKIWKNCNLFINTKKYSEFIFGCVSLFLYTSNCLLTTGILIYYFLLKEHGYAISQIGFLYLLLKELKDALWRLVSHDRLTNESGKWPFVALFLFFLLLLSAFSFVFREHFIYFYEASLLVLILLEIATYKHRFYMEWEGTQRFGAKIWLFGMAVLFTVQVSLSGSRPTEIIVLILTFWIGFPRIIVLLFLEIYETCLCSTTERDDSTRPIQIELADGTEQQLGNPQRLVSRKRKSGPRHDPKNTQYVGKETLRQVCLSFNQVSGCTHRFCRFQHISLNMEQYVELKAILRKGKEPARSNTVYEEKATPSNTEGAHPATNVDVGALSDILTGSGGGQTG